MFFSVFENTLFSNELFSYTRVYCKEMVYTAGKVQMKYLVKNELVKIYFCVRTAT